MQAQPLPHTDLATSWAFLHHSSCVFHRVKQAIRWCWPCTTLVCTRLTYDTHAYGTLRCALSDEIGTTVLHDETLHHLAPCVDSSASAPCHWLSRLIVCWLVPHMVCHPSHLNAIMLSDNDAAVHSSKPWQLSIATRARQRFHRHQASALSANISLEAGWLLRISATPMKD